MLTKLGAHILVPTSPANRYAQTLNIVKQVDGTSALALAPGGAFRIFRHWFPTQDLGRGGDSIMAEVFLAAGSNPPVDAYEGFNGADL